MSRKIHILQRKQGTPKYRKNGIYWVTSLVKIGHCSSFWGFCMMRTVLVLRTPLIQKVLIQHKSKDKAGKNIDLLNLTKNSRVCFCQSDKEKISTDCKMSGDPVCFAWNDWRKP